MKQILLAILAFYRYWISPALHSLFPSGCRFQPTCSQYATEAITSHGALHGSFLALRRLLRCHPFGGSGYDPVPTPVPAPAANHPIDANRQRATAPDPLP